MRIFAPVNIILCHHFEQGPGGGPALEAYKDDAGNATIGYGHKLLPSDPLNRQAINAAIAARLLTQDMVNASAHLNACLGQDANRLPDGAFAALIDFVFNLGIGAFERSTLHDLAVHGDLSACPAQLLKWDHARVDGQLVVLEGLKLRREAEAALWTNGTWSPS